MKNFSNHFFKSTVFTRILTLVLFIITPLITLVVGMEITSMKTNVTYPNCKIEKVQEDKSIKPNIEPAIYSRSDESISPDGKYAIHSEVSERGSLIKVIDKSNPFNYFFEYPTEFTYYDDSHLVNFFWQNNNEVLVSKVSSYIDNTLYKIYINPATKSASIEYFYSINPISDKYIEFGEYNPARTKFYIYQNCISCAPADTNIKIFDTQFNLLFQKSYPGDLENNSNFNVKTWINNQQLELQNNEIINV